MAATEDIDQGARRAFLDARQGSSRERYDARHWQDYDRDWGDISPLHERFLAMLLETTRSGGTILDAACGTGKYWASILEAGRTVVGTDQSTSMLEVARSKHPQVPLGRMELQDIDFFELFDGVVCIDALENVGPEDWPAVTTALAAAVRPRGPLYVTVELADARHLEESYRKARAAGHPVVPGEDYDGVGYHYHPPRESVLEWLTAAGLEIVDEAADDDYWHLLLRRGQAQA